MEKVLRIGVVPYLNVSPLVEGLRELDGANYSFGRVRLNFTVPSQLPNLLEQGELDVAIIPSIEYLRGRPFFAVPNISIASRGAVKSVLLFLKVSEVSRVRVLALDSSSLTSATLVKIILKERYGLTPSMVRYIRWGHMDELIDSEADAILVIGDLAMKMKSQLDSKKSPFFRGNWSTLDLGAEWKALTGLPFVYALWATKKEVLVEPTSRLLLEAKKRGLVTLKEIAHRESERLGLEPESCLSYLSENIFYELTEQELAGLRRFYHYALSMGLASEGVKLDIGSKLYIRESTLQEANRP